MLSRQVLEEMYKFEFAVDAGVKEKFEQVKSLLSTKHPQKLELEKFFEILLDEYIDRHSPEAREKRRAKRAEKKRASAEQMGEDSAESTPGTETDRISGTCRKSRGQRDINKETRHIPQARQGQVQIYFSHREEMRFKAQSSDRPYCPIRAWRGYFTR